MYKLESEYSQGYIPIQTTIQKWGNSQGIRLPKNVIDAVNMKENDMVNLEVSESTIIIKKTTEKYKNLHERLEAFYNKPIDEIHEIEPSEEINIEPMGDEVW